MFQAFFSTYVPEKAFSVCIKDSVFIDPCCGSGGMFVQSAKFIQAHSGNRGAIAVYGQEANADTWKMAKINMAIRGIDADFGAYQADTFTNDLHPTLKADFVLANPPFNYHPWNQEKLTDDVRWKYGLPPAGNANYAWIQHMIHHLAPHGKIGLVLANGALSTQSSGEGEIRKRIIQDDLIEGIVALPTQLFYSVTIPVTLWFITKGKKQAGKTLFIDARTQYAQFDTFFEGMFEKERLLDIIKNFICFSNEGLKSFKILAGYHQYFAVRKAVASTKKGTETDGKGGVFWHTQGSGKSLSMVFYAHLLQEALDSPTIVVLTDRNDLDDQLYGQFAKCSKFLRQNPIHATSREHLKNLLDGIQANGIIFTTMQKFEESHEPLSERRNIIVMADEAHRGQYGLAERIKITTNEEGEEIAKRVVGTARIIRNSLPNATYIGFTGTPISSKDRSTREVFGDYIDIYDMTQAVEDGATRPVYYESRVIKLHLDEATLQLIDTEYDIMANNADPQVIEQSKRELGQMEAVLGNEQTINSLVVDILDHYENNRANLLTGKALIVAYSRAIAMKIYNRILQLRPGWTEKVAVVMTESNKDPEEWRKVIGNKHHKDELAVKFKDNDSPLKIAIVVDMWLTGFDVPSLATMYVYKPMQGYNLMQAIARVNRVFRDKEGGLVVDYVGIASALKQAMNDYTVRDRKNYGDTDVAKVAYPKFLEKLSVCRDLFHGYDYTKFTTGTDLERAKTISGAVNFIIAREKDEDKDTFVKEALMLHQALSLCSSLVDEAMRFEAAFFESVRVLVVRLTNQGGEKKISLPEMNARINELLKQSIKSDGVINLFSDVNTEFSLFDPKFLEEISKMKEKNLAVELLKKLIAEQVSIYRRTNVVKSEKFSEIMQRAMNSYLNGMLTNEQVIEEMMKLAKQIAAAQKEGEKLGLTADELAFYDALTKPQAIKDFYENEELIAITKELAETLRKNRTIDWQKRDSARAKMRMMIKKLLKKHKYPPEGMDDAVQTVMTQCELWTDNADFF